MAAGLGQRPVPLWSGWCFPQELGAPGLRMPGEDEEAGLRPTQWTPGHLASTAPLVKWGPLRQTPE